MREWRKLKTELAERGPKKKRLPGGGKRTVLAADKEEQLVSWIESLRAKNLHVTRLSIQLKARGTVHYNMRLPCTRISPRGL